MIKVQDRRRLYEIDEDIKDIKTKIGDYNQKVELKFSNLLEFLSRFKEEEILQKVNEQIFFSDDKESYYLINFALYIQNLMHFKAKGDESFNDDDCERVILLYKELIQDQDLLLLYLAKEKSLDMQLSEKNILDTYLALVYEKATLSFYKDITMLPTRILLKEIADLIEEEYGIDYKDFLAFVFNKQSEYYSYIQGSTKKSLIEILKVDEFVEFEFILDALCMDANYIDKKVKIYPYKNLKIRKKPFIRLESGIYCTYLPALNSVIYQAIRYDLVKKNDENKQRIEEMESKLLFSNPNLMNVIGENINLNPIINYQEYIPFIDDYIQLIPKERREINFERETTYNDLDLFDEDLINNLYSYSQEESIEEIEENLDDGLDKEIDELKDAINKLNEGYQSVDEIVIDDEEDEESSQEDQDYSMDISVPDYDESAFFKNEEESLEEEDLVEELLKEDKEDDNVEDNIENSSKEEILEEESKDEYLENDEENNLSTDEKNEKAEENLEDSSEEEILEEDDKVEEESKDANNLDEMSEEEREEYLSKYYSYNMSDSYNRFDKREDEEGDLENEDEKYIKNVSLFMNEDELIEDNLEDDEGPLEEESEEEKVEYVDLNSTEDDKESLKEDKNDIFSSLDEDKFSNIRVEKLINISFPANVALLLSIANEDEDKSFYTWLLELNPSSLTSFDSLLVNISDKFEHDSSDKMVNLVDENLTLIISIDDNGNKDNHTQRINNIGAIMDLNEKDNWRMFHIIYNEDKKIIGTKTFNINRSSFSQEEWRIIQSMSLALKSRYRKNE